MKNMNLHEWIAIESPRARTPAERRFFIRSLLSYLKSTPGIDWTAVSLLEWLHDSSEIGARIYQKTIDMAEGIIAQSLKGRA